ncbi:MAG: adenosylcobinamide-GDP ribazoletransferase [Candidatus Omnitrophica bacterium]|nr:adenosylcobinamide-GDP ribazoletransferase [Candidatus Omnitrophota bacterium]MBI3083321.1 adenosylcobinamide-GDP ribazoletransferase [Candidatus Omnitrophota bacterium]
MRRFGVAIRFLTVLPAGPRGPIADADLGGSLVWFPLVGLVIGSILVGVRALTAPVLPLPAVGACVVLAWVLVTGALHLDGLGDVCDGLYGGRTPQERLHIMKDPHVGAMAVVAVTVLLILKFALVSSLPVATANRALFIAPCLGRYVMVLLGLTLPSARGGEGTAAPFVRHGRKRSLVGATAIALPASMVSLGSNGLAVFGAALMGSLLMRSVFQRTLGGITGDALGASGEVTEALGLFVVAWAQG